MDHSRSQDLARRFERKEERSRELKRLLADLVFEQLGVRVDPNAITNTYKSRSPDFPYQFEQVEGPSEKYPFKQPEASITGLTVPQFQTMMTLLRDRKIRVRPVSEGSADSFSTPPPSSASIALPSILNPDIQHPIASGPFGGASFMHSPQFTPPASWRPPSTTYDSAMTIDEPDHEMSSVTDVLEAIRREFLTKLQENALRSTTEYEDRLLRYYEEKLQQSERERKLLEAKLRSAVRERDFLLEESVKK